MVFLVLRQYRRQTAGVDESPARVQARRWEDGRLLSEGLDAVVAGCPGERTELVLHVLGCRRASGARGRRQSGKAQSALCAGGCEPDDILHRLEEFFKLFLQDGLNSEFAYLFGLKDV